MHVLTDIAHSFREAFFMFWVTLWALILGFGLSGAVQAFVSRSEMERRLGRRGPREIGRGGMQVDVANTGAHAEYEGQVFHFCSDHCRHRFEAHPQRYAEGEAEPATHASA